MNIDTWMVKNWQESLNGIKDKEKNINYAFGKSLAGLIVLFIYIFIINVAYCVPCGQA